MSRSDSINSMSSAPWSLPHYMCKTNYRATPNQRPEIDILNYDNDNTLNLLNSLTSQSLMQIITNPSGITNQTATLTDNIFIRQPNGFVSGILVSDISDHLPLLNFILKQSLFTKKSSQQNTNVKYRLFNDSKISNLRNLYLVLTWIVLQNPTIIAMESLAHAVDNTYKLCCPIKSKTFSNKDFKRPWITLEII